MAKLSRQEIYKVVNDYIGVSQGYLGDFSYRSHEEFYPYYWHCGRRLTADPERPRARPRRARQR